jgi:hypothetical protein
MNCIEKLKKLYDDKISDEFAAFRQLVVGLLTNQQEAMDRNVHSFISSSISQLDKNFDRWANGPLFFLPPSVHSKLPKSLPGFSCHCLHSMMQHPVKTWFFWSMMRQSTYLSFKSLLIRFHN